MKLKPIEIDSQQVLKFLGYGSKQASPVILRKLEEELTNLEGLFQPQVFLKELSLRQERDYMILGEEIRIDSQYARQELATCQRVFVALYSLGDRIEERIQEYSSSTEMIRGMILDKIGVVALDHIYSQIVDYLEEALAPLKLSAAVFPAQRDFPLAFQREIFDQFADENQQIQIGEAYQFSPIKTVGVLLGFGREGQDGSICDRCDQKCH